MWSQGGLLIAAPYRSPPSPRPSHPRRTILRALQWLKNLYTADDVKDQIYKLARKGLTPSKIGA